MSYKITINLWDKKITNIANSEADSMKKRVSLVIVFDKDNRVLLARRKYDPHKGEWSVPGGHAENSETSLRAAIREIKEECNITLNKKLKVLKLVILADKIITFFAVRYDGNEKIAAGSDVSEVGWFELNEIPKLGWDEIPTIFIASKII